MIFDIMTLFPESIDLFLSETLLVELVIIIL